MMVFHAFGERRSDGQMKFPAALLMITCTDHMTTTEMLHVARVFACLCCRFYVRQSGERLHLIHTSGHGLRVSDVTLQRVDLQTETRALNAGSAPSEIALLPTLFPV